MKSNHGNHVQGPAREHPTLQGAFRLFKVVSWDTFEEGTVAVSAFAQARLLRREHIRLTWMAHRLPGPSPGSPPAVGQR